MFLLSKYFLCQVPLDTFHIIFHSCLLSRILLNHLFPHHPSNKVDCYVHTKSIIYLPISIDTDRTTDVLHSANTLHISYILYILSLGVCLICCRLVGKSKLMLVEVGIKFDCYAYYMYVSLGWMGGVRLANKVPPRRLYMYIGQVVRWQRHSHRLSMIRCT